MKNDLINNGFVMNWLYEDADIYLKRKYDIFKEYLKQENKMD